MKAVILAVAALAAALSGCANLEQGTGMDAKTAGAVGGGAIGCVGGAVLARVLGGNAAAGCVAGAVAGGLVGFERARQEEIAAAEQARHDVASAFAARPGQNVQVGPVRTVEVTAVQKDTQEVKKTRAFESVTVDLPLSSKGTPEHDAAMDKLKALARRVADERGAAEIVVALAPEDARARRVSAGSDSVRTDKGGTITVTKLGDAGVPRGMERITVKAGRLQTQV